MNTSSAHPPPGTRNARNLSTIPEVALGAYPAEKRKLNRINLDLPVDLKKRLEHLAKKEGVPVSQLVPFLLYEPVQQLESPSYGISGSR